MPPSSKPAKKATARQAAGRRSPAPRLDAMMACDTAFRMVGRRYLGDLTANHEATCKGDPGALHRMRIALTRLRTAILFFSPMVADIRRTKIRHELKWLNGHLGLLRDLDVAIERLKALDKQKPRAIPYYRSWVAKRSESHRQLARALRSVRYRHLVESTADWIENGPWSMSGGSHAAGQRAVPIVEYSAAKLAQWLAKLLRKSRRLLKMDAEERHRLRLLNKKLSYSIETFEDLFSHKRFLRLEAGLKHLRRAQRALGQLNDDTRGHALAAALPQNGAAASFRFLSPKREKRLLQTAVEAYRKLAASAKGGATSD